MEGSKDDEEGGGIHCSYQIAQKPPALKERQVPKLENGTSWLEAALLGDVGGGNEGENPC